MNRTRITELMAAAGELAENLDHDPAAAEEVAASAAGEPDFGSPETDITHAIDVTGFLDAKRAAMAAHASQVAADSFFLTLPDEAFAAAFGTEWFIAPGAPRPPGKPFASDLFGAPSLQQRASR